MNMNMNMKDHNTLLYNIGKNQQIKTRNMNESTQNFKQSKEHVLHKDLSFSNQIFKKSLNPDHFKSINHDQIKSNHSSHPNSQIFMIPPLVKYNQESHVEQNIHKNTALQHKDDKDEDASKKKLNIFSGQKTIGLNLKKQQGQSFPTENAIPPLSKLQQMILKKYKKSQQNQQSLSQTQDPNTKKSKPAPYQTKVYFDKTDHLEQPNFSHHQNILNIDSLQQSRIANDSIERDNNWVLKNVDDDHEQFIEKLKRNENKDKSFLSLNNQSFRNMNPLNLVGNSLHTSYLPQFIQDDEVSLSEHNEDNADERGYAGMRSEQFNLREVKKGSKQQFNQKLSVSKETKGFHKAIPVNYVKIKQKPIKDITMTLFSHYFGTDPNFMNIDTTKQGRQQDVISENFITAQIQTKSDIDHITHKSSPPFNQAPWTQKIDNKSAVSETYTVSKIHQLSMSSYSQQKPQEHSIHDKSPQQMIASLYKDEKNSKLFLKYLQVQIAANPQNSDLCHNYQTLSCLLHKIQSITEKNSNQKSPTELAKSLLHLSVPQNNQTIQTRQQKFFKPQIIRNNQKIKIDFDPLLTYQKTFLNQKIAALKKSLELKNKQTELIKLTYDGIVHNYAVSLENLAQKAQNTQQDIGSSKGQQQNQQVSSEKSHRFQMPDIHENKNHLDVLRSSMEGIIHRKATFGKISSSFRGSATFPDI